MEIGEKGAAAPNKLGHSRQSAASNISSAHVTQLQILCKPKSQREYRCLKALVNSESGIMRFDLDVEVGTGNAPEYVSRLRMSGWENFTERVAMIDQDGGITRPGRYSLSHKHRAAALAVLVS